MKKLLLQLLFLIAILPGAGAQVLYLQTFDGISGPTFGGAGTYTFPPDMLLRNVDNLTPAGGVSYVNEAWERREDFVFNAPDSAAFSTSWYTPAGTANDFMWTPAITLTGGSVYTLSWNAVAYDVMYPDGYEVRVMTTAPTGGTGVLGNQLAASTQVFSIAAENTNWTPRTVNLDAYAGQTIYVGFRNTSYDKFILVIDDIQVEALTPFDASVSNAIVHEYAQTPFTQASVALGATINNAGSSALSNVNLHVDIYNSLNVPVYTNSSTAIPTLASGANAVFTIPSFTPLYADLYTIKYYHTQTETDPLTGNDTLSTPVQISNVVYARDTGAVIGALGIGAGNGGYLGQAYTLNNAAYVYSVTTSYNYGYTGQPYAAVIWNTDINGMPTTIAATSDTGFYADNNALMVTQAMTGGPVLLPAGNYVLTAVEFDSTIQVSQTAGIFTAGKVWVNWPTNPFGNWANVEAFGANFARPYVLRLHVGPTLVPLPSEALWLKGKAGVNSNELRWVNNEEPGLQYNYTLQSSPDAKTWNELYSESSEGIKQMRNYAYTDVRNSNDKTFYRIKVSDRDQQLKYSNTILLFNAGSSNQAGIYPNPANDYFTISTNAASNTKLQMFDLNGKLVLNQAITASLTDIPLKGFANGIYQVKLSNASGVYFTQKLIKE